MQLDPYILCVGAFATLLGAISKSGFGGGAVMATVPLLAIFAGPVEAAAILLPLLILMDAFSLKIYWRKWDRSVLMPMLIYGTIGVILGWLLFRYTPERALKGLIACLALGFCAYLAAGDRLKRNFAIGKPPAPWGILAGFTSFSVHAGGPAVNIHLLSLNLDKITFQATTVAMFAYINVIKLPSYFTLGIIGGGTMVYSLILAPLVPLGIWLGYRFNQYISQRTYFAIIITLLALAGVKLGIEAIFQTS